MRWVYRMNYNLKKRQMYMVFIIPYLVLSLLSLLSPQIISLFNLNKTAITHFQLHRLITMFFIDQSIISIVFTAYISYVLFQFLSEVVPQVKMGILLFISMLISGVGYYFAPFSLQGLEQVTSLFFTLILFFTLGVALFLYKEEMMARALISRLWFILFFEAYIIFRGGILFIFINAIIALSVAIVLFITYYFTEPKQGYML